MRRNNKELVTIPCEEAVKTAWILNNNSAFDEGGCVIGSHRWAALRSSSVSQLTMRPKHPSGRRFQPNQHSFGNVKKGSDDACLTKGIDLRVNVRNDGIEKDW